MPHMGILACNAVKGSLFLIHECSFKSLVGQFIIPVHKEKVIVSIINNKLHVFVASIKIMIMSTTRNIIHHTHVWHSMP